MLDSCAKTEYFRCGYCDLEFHENFLGAVAGPDFIFYTILPADQEHNLSIIFLRYSSYGLARKDTVH